MDFIKKKKLSYFRHIKRHPTRVILILEETQKAKETEEAQGYIGRSMWRTEWWEVSVDKQQKIARSIEGTPKQQRPEINKRKKKTRILHPPMMMVIR